MVKAAKRKTTAKDSRAKKAAKPERGRAGKMEGGVKKPASAATKMPPHVAALRAFALAYPETTEEFPWDHRVIKVRRKIFLFLNENENGTLSIAVKLPFSGDEARRMPFCEPTPYGLGKSGWVTATLKARDLTAATLRSWIDESYRAVAPKTLAAKAPAPAA